MRTLPLTASDEELLDAVREWVTLVVRGDFNAASEFVYEAKPGREGEWTPKLIEQVIRNYGSIDPFPDGRTFEVTPLATATGDLTPCHEVQRDDEHEASSGYIWFDLPLNGEWSDLTATFEFRPLDDSLVLVLDQIHVM